jgi:hypothetical protein
MPTVFFNPNGFAIVGLLLQGDSFTAQCFIDQILRPLSHEVMKPSRQEHSTKSGDIARRSLQLHFDNSQCHTAILPYCHTAKIASEELARLKCKGVLHPRYSPDLAIADFYFLGALKQNLQGIDASDDEELKSEILRIIRSIPSASGKTHSIIGSKDTSGLPQMQGTIIHHPNKTKYSCYYAFLRGVHTTRLLDNLHLPRRPDVTCTSKTNATFHKGNCGSNAHNRRAKPFSRH